MAITSAGALDGIRVLDLSRMLPGPYCSMILGDHGAEVIAVENRKLYQKDLFFGDLYRNKQHISLNLKEKQGLEIFRKLAKSSDVILEGFRPGVAQRLGVDYDTVRRFKKDVIYCSISGYGQTGPYRNMAGHDVNYMAKSGLLGLVGKQGAPPVIPGFQTADIAGGALQAAVGILLALFHRERTGEGQYIDISMTDGILSLLALPFIQSSQEQRWVSASDGRFCHRFGCYSTYETGDGRFLAVGALEPKFWQRLCVELGREEFIDIQYQENKQQYIKDELSKIFLTRTMQEWDEIFERLDNCCCGVPSLEELLQDQHFRARETIVDIPNRSGSSIPQPGVTVKLSSSPGSIRRRPPEFGADTRDVLASIGYSKKNIEEFFSTGVV